MTVLLSDKEIETARRRLRHSLAQPLGMWGGEKRVLGEAELRARVMRARRARESE